MNYIDNDIEKIIFPSSLLDLMVLKRMVLILAGGSGKRLWPLSRKKKPKQLLPIFSERSIIEETYDKLKWFDEFAIISNKSYINEFKKLLPKRIIYIEEPEARNTAPAIAMALHYLINQMGDFIVFIETADHYYQDPEKYIRDVKKACNYAEKNDNIVLIGIEPKSPHTGYGYIKRGKNLEGNIYVVEEFKEKPDLEIAKFFISENKYSWNSGTFIGKASIILAEIFQYLPQMATILDEIKESNFSKKKIQELFPKSPNISIDYGVLEKSNLAVILHSDMPWIDIGGFESLSRILHKQQANNRSRCELLLKNSKNNIIFAEKLVTLVDIKDLVIIDTNDVLLISKKDSITKIKELIEDLDENYY